MLITLLLITATAGEACADEPAGPMDSKSDAKLDAHPPRVIESAPNALPRASIASDMYTVPEDGGLPHFSATDFTPRRRNFLDPDPAVELYAEAPALPGTTLWQRMGDYRSRDRVRLLTLWESTGSAVSLQAGRRGDPSLQWTSTTMNRGGATRGVLDKLFSVSIQDAEQTLKSMGHPKGSRMPRTGSTAPSSDLK